MPDKPFTWQDVGERVGDARRTARLSQAELAAALGLDRSAVTRIETGERKLDSLELARVAALLGRPIDWFLAPPLPVVVSRRRSRESVDESQSDALLESLAHDVRQLAHYGLLDAPRVEPLPVVESVASAEQAARTLRRRLKLDAGPVWGLQAVAERTGLFAFCLGLGDGRLDGSYLRIEAGGVALVNAEKQAGRRRFTLVHELGHHVLLDDFSPEWIVGGDSEERERLVNAFAIHFLAPRESLRARWDELDGRADARAAAIVVGAEYGTSWTALVGHLRNLDLVDEPTQRRLLRERPVKADYIEGEVVLREDFAGPAVPPRYAQAVVRAFRRHKVSRGRAVELLRGTIRADELPAEDEVPLASIVGQMKLE